MFDRDPVFERSCKQRSVTPQQILQQRQSGPRAEILTVTPPRKKDITAALISLTT